MWKSININKNLIVKETAKAVLFKLPHSSDYDGYCFRLPSKLVRDEGRSGAVKMSYNDGFIFNLKKYGKGKYNKQQIISEIQLAAEDIEEAFGVQCIPNPYETHKPVAISAVKQEAIKELRDE